MILVLRYLIVLIFSCVFYHQLMVGNVATSMFDSYKHMKFDGHSYRQIPNPMLEGTFVARDSSLSFQSLIFNSIRR